MHTVVSIYRDEQDSSKKSVWQSPFTSVLPLVESNVANKLSAAAESNSQRILATLAILNTYIHTYIYIYIYIYGNPTTENCAYSSTEGSKVS
jgi:hypothetical protein